MFAVAFNALIALGWLLFCVAMWTGQALLQFPGIALCRRERGEPPVRGFRERLQEWRAAGSMKQIEVRVHSLAVHGNTDAARLSQRLRRLKRLAIVGLSIFGIGVVGWLGLVLGH